MQCCNTACFQHSIKYNTVQLRQLHNTQVIILNNYVYKSLYAMFGTAHNYVSFVPLSQKQLLSDEGTAHLYILCRT